MKLSLVVPCFNESATLPSLIDRCRALVTDGDVEVILVDNGSTDDTSRLMPLLLASVPHCKCVRLDRNEGYGSGILSGLRAARGEILGWTHADLQTDPLDARRGLALFETYGTNIFVKGLRRQRPFGDVVFTVGMSLFETLLLGFPMWDINAQPTMFPRSFFASWTAAPKDFSLDLYAYYNARRTGLLVHRFPVRFDRRLHGVSHWNVDWRSKAKFIKRTLQFSVQLRKTVNR